MSLHRCDTVVIGAGFSGLAAAHVLQSAGQKPQVIEARGRVGGRALSMRQVGGPREAGATFIGAGYRRVLAAARRHGVPLIDVTPVLRFFREQELGLAGRLIRQSEWPEDPANPFPESDRACLPWNYARILTARENPLAEADDWLAPGHAGLDISMHSWLRHRGLGERAASLAYGVNPSYGRSGHDVSALLLLFRAAFSGRQRSQAPSGAVGFTARDGVQRIPEVLAEGLAREVHLHKQATAIEADKRGVRVTCADGDVYCAPQAICSLPFPVLRTLALDPPLPPLQAEAVAGLPSQPSTQLHFAPRSEFWKTDGYQPSMFTDGVAGMVGASRDGADPEQVTSFTAWVMGDRALELDRLPERQAARVVTLAISALRPAAAGQLEFLGRQSWGLDPFARGSWSYFHPGQVTRLAARMGRRHGRVHFCGEHLARTSRGMEGAMESGERAARAVLDAAPSAGY